MLRFMLIPVLGSARIGLIFNRSQEGPWVGWLTQSSQTKWGIQYCVMSCSVLSREAGLGEDHHGLGVRWARRGESCSAHFVVCFVYSPYQYYCLLLFC